MTGVLRLALDQNFPTPLIEAMRGFLPDDVELTSVAKINPAMSTLSDVDLLIALSQLGYDGLVTNDARMLYIPQEIGAIVSTKATMVVVDGLGHDPIRGVGALLMELPGLQERVKAGRANVFRLRYQQRQSDDGWTYLAAVAERQGVPTNDLWAQVRLTLHELSTPVPGL